MRLLIDGHNLIPYMPGLDLSQMDDESGLLGFLQDYARQSRHTLEVFFDGAPQDKAGTRQQGILTVHAVTLGSTADEAIRRRLQQLGPRSRETAVVSSDRQVQSEAKARGARTIHSDQFARELAGYLPQKKEKPVRTAPVAQAKPKAAPPLPADEVQEWMRIFRGEETTPKPGGKRAGKPSRG